MAQPPLPKKLAPTPMKTCEIVNILHRLVCGGKFKVGKYFLHYHYYCFQFSFHFSIVVPVLGVSPKQTSGNFWSGTETELSWDTQLNMNIDIPCSPNKLRSLLPVPWWNNADKEQDNGLTGDYWSTTEMGRYQHFENQYDTVSILTWNIGDTDNTDDIFF